MPDSQNCGHLIKIWQVFGMGTFFALQPMDNMAFDMNAVIIKESCLPQGYQLSRWDDLPSYHVHHAYSLSGELYIPFKQYVFDSK